MLNNRTLNRSVVMFLLAAGVAAGGCVGAPGGDGEGDPEQLQSARSSLSLSGAGGSDGGAGVLILADAGAGATADAGPNVSAPPVPPLLAAPEAPAESGGLSATPIGGGVATIDLVPTESSPSYLLYRYQTRSIGTCADCKTRLGTYLGKVKVPFYNFNTNLGPVAVYQPSLLEDIYWTGVDTLHYAWKTRGFTTGYKYHGCYGGFVTDFYYGADKVSQDVDESWDCPDTSGGSCSLPRFSYEPWRAGW